MGREGRQGERDLVTKVSGAAEQGAAPGSQIHILIDSPSCSVPSP